jgi:hypothetical protein
MHARAAYIRSFGTTGILLVASLLMLAMVGAVVGFHRWPGDSVVQSVPSVPLKPASTTHFRAVRPAATGVHKAKSARAAHRAGARSATAGLVKVVPVHSPVAVGYPVSTAPGSVTPGTPGPSQPSGAGATAPDQPRPPATPTAPSAPQPLQTLVEEIVQSVPPIPGVPQRGQPLQIQIQIPIAGLPAIETPPLP